jgi:selenocysteine-specific elongation factor
MRVLGTAGHVDHGKSTLVKALTGINPDRLKEELAREMTIELGFAWMTLPNGEEAGIVDVPGHRDFIENMLAGVGGMDAALFVVAADEGVMPQTREHLAILDILQVNGGVIVITKTDLAESPEWLDMIEDDVRNVVRGTVMENCTLLRVSAKNGTGLDALKNAIVDCLKEKPVRPDLGRPRLPIDRVFTMPGFGTVVTGTLLDGSLHVGDGVEILPTRLKSRIRGLQSHRRKTEEAFPGGRTAVNITGIDVSQVQRGDLLVHTDTYRLTKRMDVYFRLIKDASKPLKHDVEVKLFLGAAEVHSRVRLLGVDQILPGQEGWLQLELQQPVAAVRGDRYILRRPSPGETLGGGQVLDPHPDKRHRRFDTIILERLAMLREGSYADILYQTSLSMGAASLRDIFMRSRLSADQFNSALHELVGNSELLVLESGAISASSDILVAAKPQWESDKRHLFEEVDLFHHSYPLKNGIGREELKSRLKWPGRFYTAALKKIMVEGELEETTQWVARKGHTIHYSEHQITQISLLMKKFDRAPFSPPTVKECQEEYGENLINSLVESGDLVQVSPEVVFRKEAYQTMLDATRQMIITSGGITVAQFRDRFDTSRRYALGFLEHLDGMGVTRREGDIRRLKKNKG